MNPGVYYGMDADEYHAVEALSASGARKLRRAPAHYKLMRDQPAEPTAAMQFGSAVHLGVLEPDTFDLRVACAPEVDKRTKDGQATWEAFKIAEAGKIILSVEDYVRAEDCVDAVNCHPAARRLLEGAKTEVSLFWEDGKYKVPCKCRYDALNRGGGIDLKTTQDASPSEFAKSVANFEYHAQAAHYISGAEHALNESPRFFAFIAVESEPPHLVAVYYLPTEAILMGQHLMAIALERYKQAIESGNWKGYSDTIEMLRLPRWALRYNIGE